LSLLLSDFRHKLIKCVESKDRMTYEAKQYNPKSGFVCVSIPTFIFAKEK